MEALTILIPTLNEIENVKLLLPKVQEVVSSFHSSWEILLCDGGSHDGTPKIAAELGARVIQQKGQGYGDAIKSGLIEATGDLVLTMDADNSHRPDYIPAMIEASKEADLVIASRYIQGGSAVVGFHRRVLSQLLNAWYRQGLNLPFKDLTSGFRLYRRSVIAKLEIESNGYQFLPEILFKMHNSGHPICEVPFAYCPRAKGCSHVRLIRFGWAYLKCYFRLRALQ